MNAMSSMKETQSGISLFTLVFVLLWLGSVVSAMGVVYSTYQSRKATQQLESLRIEASGLQIMSGQYLLEKSSWSAYSRVEEIAAKQLKMVAPEPEKTVLVYRK
ncbi:Cell division protein FtsL [Thalassocella blandensis]|nr:Cell division protein FtsL [Thalassocella blandensis]